MNIKYKLMLGVAFCMAILSSILTALGMMDLFAAASVFILFLFVIIDLGRFLLFNFVVDEWNNLRKIKYVVVFILSLLFIYSAVGIYSKLTSLITEETKQALVNVASYNTAMENAYIKKDRSEDLATIAREEYNTSIEWNKKDYQNCITRAQSAENVAEAENKCNNTKSRLDKKASATLKEALANADTALTNTQDAVKQNTQNRSEIAAVLTTICKLTNGDCNTYDGLYQALSIIIFLVIIGTDYLQIAIVLSINTRKNKPELPPEPPVPPRKPKSKENEDIDPEDNNTRLNNSKKDLLKASITQPCNILSDSSIKALNKEGRKKKLESTDVRLVLTGETKNNSVTKEKQARIEHKEKYRTMPPIPWDRLFSKNYHGPKPYK